MNRPVLTLRSRIQLWHGLLLACVLAAFGVTAYKLHWADELRRIDRDLNEPLSLLHRALAVGGRGALIDDGGEGGVAGRRGRGPPENFVLASDTASQITAHGCYYLMWSRDGKQLVGSADVPADVAMPARNEAGAFVTLWRGVGKRREAFIFTPPGECLLTGISIERDLAALSHLGWLLAALGAGVLCVGLLVDAWILRRSIRPVEQIISTAESISAGRLSARIKTPAANDEIGRLARVLNQTFASLDGAFTHQARFSADVAHELRTPVSVLITEAQRTLERERDGTEYRETVATVLRSAQRMSVLIESLLQLAQIPAGDAAEKQGECDLSEIALDAADIARPMCADQRITLHFALLPAPCTGNVAQLAQVAANLLINAIQHNRRDGSATLMTGIEDGRATLRVKNTGPCIPAEHLPHVFERFYRADASRSRKTGGSGLGLSICKAIADAHGAELSVSSDAADGTVFTLRMPPTNARL